MCFCQAIQDFTFAERLTPWRNGNGSCLSILYSSKLSNVKIISADYFDLFGEVVEI